MKLSRCVLLALLGLLSVSGVIAAQREVRTYTNEMEYVDDVQQHATPPGAALATEPEYATPLARVVAEAAAMMETEAASAYDAYATQAEEEALNIGSFLESGSSAAAELGLAAGAEQLSDVDTQVARAMALEIHEHAQAMLEAEEEQGANAMLVEINTEAEAEAETEAEAEVEAEAEAEAEADSSADAALQAEAEMEAEVEAEVDAEMEASVAAEADPAGLSSDELAQEMMDRAAESADRAAEQADQKEEAKDVSKALKDGIPIGVVPKVPKAPKKTVVQLPEDLSVEHRRALRVNAAATRTIRGALGEVGAILASKDDTIRSLVANISYLTVNTGRLANQIDRQRAYIRLLQDKLKVAGLKDRELRAHVSQSSDTVLAVRAQLAAVEKRLNKQGQTTAALTKLLRANEDSVPTPALTDNIEVRGTPVKKLKAAALKRRARAPKRRAARLSNIGSFFNGPAAPAMPTHYMGRPIPTIIVEETDDGR